MLFWVLTTGLLWLSKWAGWFAFVKLGCVDQLLLSSRSQVDEATERIVAVFGHVKTEEA